MANGLTVVPHCRVIVDNDYQGDPDGLVALAHHLLSPANRVTAITSSFLNTRFPVASPRAEDGAVLARQLLEVVGGSSGPPVHAGSEAPFGDQTSSAASAAIAAEARREDDLPLYVAGFIPTSISASSSPTCSRGSGYTSAKGSVAIGNPMTSSFRLRLFCPWH